MKSASRMCHYHLFTLKNQTNIQRPCFFSLFDREFIILENPDRKLRASFRKKTPVIN